MRLKLALLPPERLNCTRTFLGLKGILMQKDDFCNRLTISLGKHNISLYE
jgi:hypothetical protein